MTRELVMDYVACNLCGSDNYATKFVVDGFHIVECQHCGLVYVNPRLPEDDILALYDTSYYSGQGFDDAINYEEDCASPPDHLLAANWAVLSAAKRFCKTRGGSLLDIGCGLGLLLLQARQEGWDACGLETSSVAATRARSLGLEVYEGSLIEISFPQEVFDAVTMIEVIEHLLDPRQYLNEVRRILKPGGILLLTTGNIEGRDAKRSGSAWSYLRPQGHLYYFSPRTLGLLLSKCGLQVVGAVSNQKWVYDLFYRLTLVSVDQAKRSKGGLLLLAYSLLGMLRHLTRSSTNIIARQVR